MLMFDQSEEQGKLDAGDHLALRLQALEARHDGQQVGDRPQEQAQNQRGQEGNEEARQDRPRDQPFDGGHMGQPVDLQPNNSTWSVDVPGTQHCTQWPVCG